MESQFSIPNRHNRVLVDATKKPSIAPKTIHTKYIANNVVNMRTDQVCLYSISNLNKNY